MRPPSTLKLCIQRCDGFLQQQEPKSSYARKLRPNGGSSSTVTNFDEFFLGGL